MTYTIANASADELNLFSEFMPYQFTQDGTDAILTVDASDESYIESIFFVLNISHTQKY